MHGHDDKYPARPGFEPGTSGLQTPVDTNEPSGRAGSDIECVLKVTRCGGWRLLTTIP